MVSRVEIGLSARRTARSIGPITFPSCHPVVEATYVSIIGEAGPVPVEFLTDAQAATYGCYSQPPSPTELDRSFLLDDKARGLIESKRLPHTRLGYAVSAVHADVLGNSPAVLRTPTNPGRPPQPRCDTGYRWISFRCSPRARAWAVHRLLPRLTGHSQHRAGTTPPSDPSRPRV